MSLDTQMRNEFEENADRIGYKRGYAAAIADAVYCLEEAKGYTVDFNKHMDYAIDAIKALLSRGSR